MGLAWPLQELRLGLATQGALGIRCYDWVLIERGVLMQAATSPRPVEANRLYAKFGLTHSQVPYAHWHARGAGVPERDPVPKLPPSVIQMMLEKVAERIRQEFAR